MPKAIKVGRKERMTFAKIPEDYNRMPNLIEIQTASFKHFLDKGLMEVLRDASPIKGYSDLEIEFLGYKIAKDPKNSEEECKRAKTTYEVPIEVQASLRNVKTNETQVQYIHFCNLPLMTDKGTFVYNGAERSIVTQLVRSPGAYFTPEKDKYGHDCFALQMIPQRGAWIEYEYEPSLDGEGSFAVRLDRTKKLPLTVFLRAIGVGDGKTENISELFAKDQRIEKTLKKDQNQNREDGLREVYRKMRPSDPESLESASRHVNDTFFDSRRYNLDKVGRFKYNQKLGLSQRIAGTRAADNVYDGTFGDMIVEKDGYISTETALRIENSGCKEVFCYSNNKDRDGEITKVIGNNFVDIKYYINEYYPKFKDANWENLRVAEKVHFPILKEIIENSDTLEQFEMLVMENLDMLSPRHLLNDDVIASVSYILNLTYNIGTIDDIDHLGNRRLRTVGELLQNQFSIGISKMEKNIKEKMSTAGEDPHIKDIVLTRVMNTTIREFFGSSQLSQFMDQNNPLSELTHKRRVSALGPGGLTRDRAKFDVRDIHYTHYGRLCPIETPEGPNIGLIGSITTYAKVNEYGFIETPYRVVKHNKKKDGTIETIVTDEIKYLPAFKEDEIIYLEDGTAKQCVIAQANEPLDSEGHFLNEKVASRRYKGEIVLSLIDDVDYMDISPKQVVSVAAAMIPFLENDDANRALMGSNMQRQAVPLLVTEAPVVGTGIEYKAACDSGVVVLSKEAGTVEYVDANKIKIRRDDDNGIDEYELLKFKRSNQGTCIHQRPIVSYGEHIEKGEVIADGPATSLGEIALGKNLLIAFMTWEGYNYEDAIVLNEKLLMDDVLTSIHIEEYEVSARNARAGADKITRDFTGPGEDAISRLDDDGIIAVGSEVKSGDYLVGKVSPKGDSELSPEEKLLYAVFGPGAKDTKDTSLKLPHGSAGVVIHTDKFLGDDGFELPNTVNEIVRVTVATKRKINVGDKMAGRHGNKGVVSRILPQEDMPFLDDGRSIQVMLNPLGVPSRMNVGQVLEVHLGLAAMEKGWYVATPVFDGATEKDIINLLKDCGFSETGKIHLRDGRTGEYFDNPVTVGYMYMMKLHHLVDDKIHARSTGPYALVTQQPLGGKAQFGGQRFGEMEVWALEAYGAANVLQEILTVKSDDINGRYKTYEAIIKGENLPKPGIPESFKVLMREMQSLCLDVKALDKDDKEISLKESSGFEGSYKKELTKISDFARENEPSKEEMFEEPEDDYLENLEGPSDEALHAIEEESLEK